MNERDARSIARPPAAVHDVASELESPSTRFRDGVAPPVRGEQHGAQTPSASERAFGRPISIDYLSNTKDKVMTAMGLLTFGEVVGDDVTDMVDKILAKAGGRPIGHLTITGHGESGKMDVGQHGAIGLKMTAEEREQLARLSGHFAPNAEVVLGGCQVAAGDAGEQFLMMLAKIWGVRVRASVTYQRALEPGMEGNQVTAEPTSSGGAKLLVQEFITHKADRWAPPGIDRPLAMHYYTTLSDKGWQREVDMTERYHVLRRCLDGFTSKEERTLAVRVMQVSTPDERRRLYRQIEGHNWRGDFRHGWAVADDSLWNNLTSSQREELKGMLNE